MSRIGICLLAAVLAFMAWKEIHLWLLIRKEQQLEARCRELDLEIKLQEMQIHRLLMIRFARGDFL